LGDASLGGRQGIAAGENVPPWSRSGGFQLFARALGQRGRAAAVGEVESLAQWLSGVGPMSAASDGGSVVDQRSRVFELCRRALEFGDRRLKEVGSVAAWFDQPVCSKGHAERSRLSERACERDLLFG
jgi:hypothetical protein